MQDRLGSLEKRFEELTVLLAQPEVAATPNRMASIARERATLEDVVTKYREYRAVTRNLEETRTLMDDGLDPDMTAMVKEEIEGLSTRQKKLFSDLKLALISQDPNDARNVIVEIRAGTGGGEAALFAADLFRMYSRYAQGRGWQMEIIDAGESGMGGLREVIFEVNGSGAFGRLKYERGVHRVQRVPLTEASGRIHTSTATVAVLPQIEEVEVDIDPGELKVDIFHSGGAGGQNVNKVATAVRITHLPTGIVAVCQDERSQLRNRTKAMGVLRARLQDREEQKQQDKVSRDRRSQVGSGERAEKIRTYNFPQDRLTDHRTGQTMHNLPRILDGEIEELLSAVAAADQAQQLEAEPV